MLKSSHLWEQFLTRVMHSGGELAFDPLLPNDWLEMRSSKEFETCLRVGCSSISDSPLGQVVKSGEPIPPIQELDRSLRRRRCEDHSRPLLVFARPRIYWQRSLAWHLGEYLAERDLPLWIDLESLHPKSLVDWARHLGECGLACPRLLIEVPDRFSPKDFPALKGSGAWLFGLKESARGSGVVCQF